MYPNMLRCSSCKKNLPENEFKRFKETPSKTCVQCLSKRKQKNIIRKISQNQLDDSSSERQNIQTNMPSDIENPTDNIEYNREIHIDQLSQLVSELTDENNNLSEFELNITFDVEDENDSISQIAEKIRDEFAEGDGYKWK
jgi:hypothetical protein